MRNPIENNANGGDEMFHTTHGSVIIAARTGNEHQRRAIISDLATRYWRPAYCYLRRERYCETTAKDLTQGFFCETVLGRELIQHADQAKRPWKKTQDK